MNMNTVPPDKGRGYMAALSDSRKCQEDLLHLYLPYGVRMSSSNIHVYVRKATFTYRSSVA
jgi:hypothetical protein